MNNLALLEKKDLTMSSLEIVDLINKSRKEGESELRHDHFMEKVVKVLGEKQSPEFLGDYKDSKNRTYKCYYFPKRESMLMAMSYSYELQAKIYDLWEEKEMKHPQKSTLQMLAEGFAQMARLEEEQIKIKEEQERQAKLLEVMDERGKLTSGYLQIKAWGNLNNVKIPQELARVLGKSCSKFCKENAIAIGKVHDEQWGNVNSYPVEVIAKIYQDAIE